MFVLNQRVSILSTNLLALRQLTFSENNKIKINKSNVYYEDRIDLKN
jgi:hypothetical protein